MEKQNIEELLKESKEFLDETYAYLKTQGIEVVHQDWFTIKRYCEKFNIEDQEIVNNWIATGKIPPENIKELEELKGVKLIKAIAYE